MAAWQFELYLIPWSVLHELGLEATTIVPEAIFEEGKWFSSVSLPSGYEDQLNAILPFSPNPLFEDLRFWGTEKGNRVTIVYEESEVSDVEVRIDVTGSMVNFAEAIVTLAQSWNCLLVLTENRVIVKPRINTLLREIVRSRSAAFVREPKGFIERIEGQFGNLN